MQLRLSMVHNNPGEKEFDTKFADSQTVLDYGFNGQVFRQINTIVSFDELGLDLFPRGSKEREWLNNFSKHLIDSIRKANRVGLKTYHHIDLFVLPKKLVKYYKNKICDENGKISVEKEKTLMLHRVMIDEIFKIVPELDGLIVRVGETYLHDTPYHTGNGAVDYGDKEREKAQFVKLLEFLREEICVKHNKKLIFRTWDCFDDRFHADPEYYLDVTDKIAPHENLYFSMKYTSLDFWRYVKWNGCILKGRHKQIIEIQCQREYEGKGAYPSYVMDDIINGDRALSDPSGLKKLCGEPLFAGVFVWPRGGGWKGPYAPDEFWSDLNTYVISHYAADTKKTEEEIFNSFAKERLCLSDNDARLFRKLCLTADKAILKSRYIYEYDKLSAGAEMPCKNWLRDDMAGGLYHLEPVLDILYEKGKMKEALKEKKEGLELWKEALSFSESIDFSGCDKKEFIVTSCEYAVRLFTALYYGWAVMIYGHLLKKGYGKLNELCESVAEFDRAYDEYKELSGNKNAATLYRFDFYFWNQPGLKDSVEEYRKIIKKQEAPIVKKIVI